MKKLKQKIFNIVKNHPIKILVGGTSGITILSTMGRVIFTLEYTDIIQGLTKIKNLFIDNIAIIILCICIIVISTYIFIFKSKKLKSNESTNQKIIKEFKDILNDNIDISNIEIRKNEDELSISMNTNNKKYNSSPPNNIYNLKDEKETKNKEIKSN